MRRGEFPLQALPAWCSFNDVSFNGVRVEKLEGRGLGLVTETDLLNKEDRIETPALLKIPRELVLSAEAVEDFAKVDKNFRVLLDAVGHQSHRLDILLFLLMQYLISSPDYTGPRGSVSSWTQYFSLLPAQVPVPTMWTESEVDFLRGTSLQYAVTAKLSTLSKEFDAVRTSCDGIPFWSDLLCVDELITVRDWILLDALYRSRSLGLPLSGESMVPCLDLVNHSKVANAYFEETTSDEVALLLKDGCAMQAGTEITIDYGKGKSAAEMVFSYGFMDPESPAASLTLPLQSMDDDPLAKAKLHVFGTSPTLKIEDADDGLPKWDAPFVYLMCLNEEDGLDFKLLQENDGSRHLRLYWCEEDVTEKAGDFGILILGHELSPIFQLRAVTLVLEQVSRQIETLSRPFIQPETPDLVRKEVFETVSQLRNSEMDLMQRALQVMEGQRDKLLDNDTVLGYLGSMEEVQKEKAASEVPNRDEDFS